jgi:hypothetical protein
MCNQAKTKSLTCLLSLLLPTIGLAQICHTAVPASAPTSQFIDNGNGTVTDKKTGLMWKRCSEGQTWSGVTCTGDVTYYAWQSALQQVQVVNNSGGFASKTDWRMPNIKELASIFEEQCWDPAFNVTVFPIFSHPNVSFWSSSSPNRSKGAFFIGNNGYVQVANKSAIAPVLLVRNVQ